MTLLSLTNESMTLKLSTRFEKRTPLLEGSDVRCLRFKERYGARTAWPGLVVLVPFKGRALSAGIVMIEASSDSERGKVKLVAMLPMRDPVERYGTARSSGAMRACG